MEAQGRMPNLSPTGQFIGFKSRAGAPQSPLETMPVSKIGNTGVTVAYGTQGHDAAWNAWFHPTAIPSTSGQPQVDPNDDSGKQQLPASPAAHVNAAVASHSAWLGSNGISFPPPPAGLSQPTTNPMQFPNMANDPAQEKSAFVTPAGVDPGYVSRVQDFNTNLYKPADTQPINTQPPAAPTSNWNRTGWNGPASPVSAGNYTSQYGTGSVRYASTPADNAPSSPIMENGTQIGVGRNLPMNNWLASAPTMN